MASETTHYNVYRVFMRQSKPPDHDALALVSAQFDPQDRGRSFHVKGAMGVGMDYECKKGYTFGTSEDFNHQEFVFRLERARLGEWEVICEEVKPPYDPRSLFGEKVSVNCSTWIDEVLEMAQYLAAEC